MEYCLTGEPILITFRPKIRAWRGKLLSGGTRGERVLAGSFLRERLIVLDASLLHRKAERDRVIMHEISHFVWWKLPNQSRLAYEQVVSDERQAGLSGEMGWSAEWRKAALTPGDWTMRSRRLREYLCESFCDTAAATLLRLRAHDEISLAKRAYRVRRKWMEQLLAGQSLKI